MRSFQMVLAEKALKIGAVLLPEPLPALLLEPYKDYRIMSINSCSDRIVTRSSRALSSLLPASEPATT